MDSKGYATDSDGFVDLDLEASLVDGTDYLLMNTGGGKPMQAGFAADVYVVKASAEPAAVTEALAESAIVLRPNGIGVTYTPKSGESAYAFSPGGPGSVSVNDG